MHIPNDRLTHLCIDELGGAAVPVLENVVEFDKDVVVVDRLQ